VSIQNIGRNRWRCSYKDRIDPKTGKPHWADKVVKGTKQDAQDYVIMHSMGGEEGSKVTLGAFLNSWLSNLELDPVSIDDYRYGIRYVEPLHHILLSDLTPSIIEEHVRSLPQGSRRHRAKKVLRTSLKAAVRLGKLAANPMDLVNVETGKGQSRKYQPYSAGELYACLESFRGHVAEPTIIVMSYSGSRLEEALALDWEDINLDTGEVDISKAWARAGNRPIMKPTKTEKSTRTTYVLGAGLVRLREIAGTGPLWPGRKHEHIRPDAAGRTFRRHSEACGLRYIPINTLRHTYATLALDAGVPVEVLSPLLGHSRVGTTLDRYVRPPKDKAKAAAQTFAAALEVPKNSQKLG
jgi:integrase